MSSNQQSYKPPVDSIASTTSKEVKDKVRGYLEGSMTVLPNPKYKAKTAYKVTGCGNIFNGAWYFRKVKHTIGASYTVDAEVVKFEALNIIVENRKDPVPPAKPAKPEDTVPYKVINRMGQITANSGLNMRKGDPQPLKVNSRGYVYGDASSAPSIGTLRKGSKLKVKYENGEWYYVEYKGGAWCYKKYVKLL